MNCFSSSVSFHLNSRHIQSNTPPPQPPVPPLGYVSGTLISDLETDVPDEDADDEEEPLEIPRPLRALDQTPGSSMDNLDSSVTGNKTDRMGICDLFAILKCITNQMLPYVRFIQLHLFLQHFKYVNAKHQIQKGFRNTFALLLK